jgi:high frequency lysogenization protein
MLSTIENQTTALAGLFLATELVHQIATRGDYDEGDMRIALESLFTLESESVPAVFGGKANLRPGLQRLVAQLGGTDTPKEMQITRYVLTLLKLSGNLRPDTMQQIRRGVEEAEKLRLHFDTLDMKVISKLANVYSTNISPISPKVYVQGNPTYLQQDNHANCVRACLLAGVRSAVLWKQCNGSRLRLLFARQKFINQANRDLGLNTA